MLKKITKRVVKITRYLFFGKGLSAVVKNHLVLKQTLDPFKEARLISVKTYFIYLFSYLSRSLNVQTKLNCLVYNYKFLQECFSTDVLKQIFTTGIQCYEETKDEDKFTIVLIKSGILEIEGSLSLFFKMNDVKIAALSFSIVPGAAFDLNQNSVIYIGCLQRIGKQAANITKAIKQLNDIIPAMILLKAIEALADSLKINNLIGVLAKDQLALNDPIDYPKYHAVYDDFWALNGGVFENDSYIIPIPVPQKDILSIKQTHRNRTRKKRQKLNEIYLACNKTFGNKFNTTI